jgi:hypothetical protein
LIINQKTDKQVGLMTPPNGVCAGGQADSMKICARRHTFSAELQFGLDRHFLRDICPIVKSLPPSLRKLLM